MELVAPEVRSVFERDAGEAFAKYHAELSFVGKILGGVPRDPKIIEGWLRAKAGVTNEEEIRRMMARTLAELGADDLGVEPSMEDLERASEKLASMKHSCGFKQDAGEGLYIEARQVKAAIKEAVNIKFAGERWGATRKGPKSFTAERVFVAPDHIYLGRTEPDNIETFIGHISDQSGKRATLNYFEYVERPVITFEVEVLDDSIKHEDWGVIWSIAERGGLGAVRSQNFGQFKVTRWEKI